MDISNNGNGGHVSGETNGRGGDDQVTGIGVDAGGGELDQGRAMALGGPSGLPGASEGDVLGTGGGGGDQDHVVVVEVHQEGDPNGTISNDNFSEITKEGTKGFACNICSEFFDQPSKVKRHITMKHLKPANDTRAKRGRDSEEENLENKKHKYIFSESILDEFERTGMFITSTQVEEKIEIDDESNAMDETIVRAIPESVDLAMEIIKELDHKVKQLEEELKHFKKKVASQDSIISTKEDALLVFQGTVNSLEEEIKNLEVRNARLENVIARMKGEIVHLRETKTVGDKTKRLEKDLKEAETRVNENIKKIEDLVTSKAKVEAELVRMTKVCDFQMEAMDHSRDKKQDINGKEGTMVNKDIKKINVKCRQFETFSRCEYGDGCRYLHPSTICEYYAKVGKCPIGDCKELHRSYSPSMEKAEKVDCCFWTSGYCKYSEAECKRGRHVADKLGIYKRREHFLSQGLAGRVSANHQVLGSNPPGMGGQPAGVGQPVMMGGQTGVVGGQPGGMGGQPRVLGGQPGGTPAVGMQPAYSGLHPVHQQGVWGQKTGSLGQQTMLGQSQGMPGQRSTMMGGSQATLGQSFIGEEHGMLGLNQVLMGQHQSSLGQQQSTMGPQQSTMGPQQSTLGPQQSTMGPRQSTMGPHQSTMGPRQSQGQQQGMLGQQAGMLGLSQSLVGQNQNESMQQVMRGQVVNMMGQQQQQQNMVNIQEQPGVVGTLGMLGRR